MRYPAVPGPSLDDTPALAALHNPDVTPTEIRNALTCLVERMAEDAAPAFGMLLELDSQARELGISVPALEDDFASELAVSPSDEPQSCIDKATELCGHCGEKKNLCWVRCLAAATSPYSLVLVVLLLWCQLSLP